MKHFLPGVSLLLFLLSFSSCKEEAEIITQHNNPSLNLSQQVYAYMHEWYLWNNDIPDVDTSGIHLKSDLASAIALMDTMRKKENPPDRWSYIEEAATYDNYFNKGQYEGYGFSMVVDLEGQLRVAYVFSDSPFYRAGVGRSWIITIINGKSVAALLENNTLNTELENKTNTFEFIDAQGNAITKTITKSKVGINSVLYKNVYEINGKNVGYLVFNNFLQTSLPELQETFQYFEQQGIDELILDLRYNGGGRVNIAQYITSNLLGNKGSGQTFLKYLYSELKSSENQTVGFSTPEYHFNLNRLLIITSRSTASSSELVINGIKPFLDVILIGDNTYGKPVGSSPIKHDGYVISTINFKTVNHLDQGEYFDGLPVDAFVPDDLTHDFGDPEEGRLKEALYYIANGAFSEETARSSFSPKEKRLSVPLTGFQLEIGAY